MIKKIILENYKPFDKAEIEIKPITVLVGPNSGGKSSLMQPFNLIKQTFLGNVNEVLKLKNPIDFGDFDELLHQNSNDKFIRFRFDFEKNVYIDIKFVEENGKIFVKEFSCNNGTFEYTIAGTIKKIQNKKGIEYYKAEKFKIKSNIFQRDNIKYLIPNLNPSFYKDHFFFKIRTLSDDKTDKEALFNFYEEAVKNNTNSDLKSDFLKLLEYYLNLQKLSNDFHQKVKLTFDKIRYIGPLRAEGSKYYEISSYDNVGFRGEFAIQMIEENPTLFENVQYFLKKLDIADSIVCQRSDKQNVFEMLFKTGISEEGVNFSNVGCGTSQILPIIVQCLCSEDDSMVIIEQPETHLHPKVQAELASFIVESIKLKSTFIIETHSEYFVERLRTCVMKNPRLAKDIAIYYIEQNKNKKHSEIIKMEINSEGQYTALPEGYLTNISIREIDDQMDLMFNKFETKIEKEGMELQNA